MAQLHVVTYQGLYYNYDFYCSAQGVSDWRISRANQPKIGEIHYAKIVRFAGADRACFAEIASGETVYVDSKKLKSTVNDQAAFRVGDGLFLQIYSEAIADKRARASGQIELTSPSLVLVTDRSGLHISRKITDEHFRQSLRQHFNAKLTKRFGIIVRSAARGRSLDDLQRQLRELISYFNTLNLQLTHYNNAQKIAESGALDKRESTQLKASTAARQPASEACLYDTVDLYDFLNRNLARKIVLNNGTEIVIDELEAVTAIDVNSHRVAAPITPLQLNLAAMPEILNAIARRCIAGTVLIDLLNLTKSDQKRFLAQLKASQSMRGIGLKGFTATGLLELAIAKRRQSLQQAATDDRALRRVIKPQILIDYVIDKLLYRAKYHGQTVHHIAATRALYAMLIAKKTPLTERLAPYQLTIYCQLCEYLTPPLILLNTPLMLTERRLL